MPAHRTFEPERIAQLILEAMELGISPVQTLMNITGVRIDQARYQIRKVKADGFLGRQPHRPVRVYVRPHTPRELIYLACDHCHVPFPCPEAFPLGRPNEPLVPMTKKRKRATS